MQVKRGEFGGLNDVTDGDFLRRTRQGVPATSASRAADDPSAPHAQQNLLNVVAGQLLSSCHISPGHRPVPCAPREV